MIKTQSYFLPQADLDAGIYHHLYDPALPKNRQKKSREIFLQDLTGFRAETPRGIEPLIPA